MPRGPLKTSFALPAETIGSMAILPRYPLFLAMMSEYALRDQRRPMAAADWETQLVEKLPDALKGNLPSIEGHRGCAGTRETADHQR